MSSCAFGTAPRSMRYMVVPERPRGTESMSEEELAALITRDALVGVAQVALPGGNA